MKNNLAEKFEYKHVLLGEQYIDWFFSLTGRKPKWYPTHLNNEDKRVWCKLSDYRWELWNEEISGDQASAKSPNPKPKTGGLTMKT